MKKNLNYLFQSNTDSNIERNRLFFITALSTFFSKGVSFVVLLVSLPLTLSYLGAVNFAIVNTIISTFYMFNYLDFGVGIGVQNLLPQFIADNNSKRIVEIISTAFTFLLFAGLFVLLAGISVILLFDWRIFFNLGMSIDSKIFNWTLLSCVILIALGMPLTLIQRLQIAYQKAYINEWFVTFGNILSIIFVYLTIHYQLKLPFIIFSLQGTLVVAMALNFFYFFVITKKYPLNFSSTDKSTFKLIFQIGLKYLFLLIFSVGLFSIDNLLLLKFRSPAEVTEYMVGYRLISLFNVPVLIFSNTFLPAYNDALARNDRSWVRNIILRFIKIIAFLSFVEGIIIYFFGRSLIQIWTSQNFNYSNFDFFYFALLLIFLNFNTFFSMIAISTKYLNFTLKFFILAVSLTVLFKYLWTYNTNSGYESVILSTVLIMPMFFLLPLIIKIFKSDINI
jgi:O-antigen/teichoic acid export membrane protein